MAEKFVHVRELNIPDDSSPDGVAPAMWGPYIGGGKMHRFYCKDCNMYIGGDWNVNVVGNIDIRGKRIDLNKSAPTTGDTSAITT